MKKSFTLIELSVVIAVIAILLGVIIPNAVNFMEKSRDAKRVSDINTIALALESFYDDNGRYPNQADDGVSSSGEKFDGSSNIENVLKPYIRGGIPKDPLYKNSSSQFYYAYDPSHSVDWCDSDATNDTSAPVLGFRRKETDSVELSKDTCEGSDQDLDNAVYNIAFVEPD
ncbi:MAG: type II secretion system protein GspG [Candidatus Omnitrophica bacterium]|nr:type II secretion system protein GspG [Candidatus Omnitrophota bacterium]MCF7894111.1 type II secretion system protein GspG [Candidatus Omnitrophota bacterium]